MHYRYYVYIRPGHIEYFDDLTEAQKCAELYGTIVKEV